MRSCFDCNVLWSKSSKKVDKIPWLLVAYKILGMMLLVIFIALIFVGIVLIIIALAIICGDANINLSGIGSIGRGSSKKKKEQL